MTILRISTDGPTVLAEDEAVRFCICRSAGVEESSQHLPLLSVKLCDGLVGAIVVKKSCEWIVSRKVELVNVGI